MNSLAQLRQRKAVLKEQIEQQRVELKNTFLEVREEIEPSFLLKKAIQGLFKPSKDDDAGTSSNFFERFPLPIGFLVDLFVKNKAIAALLKMLAPAALKIIPALFREHAENESGETDASSPVKAKVYGTLRQTVSSLRNQLKKDDKTTAATPESTEN